MFIWICLFLLIAIVLILGIEQIMQRIGIRPADPASRSRSIRELRDRLPRHRNQPARVEQSDRGDGVRR